MRILILTPTLTRGGAERVAALWANGFVERGHDVCVVVNARPDTPITYSLDSRIRLYNIYSWLGLKLSWHLNFQWFMALKLRKVIRQEHPDVIIAVLHPRAEWARLAIWGMKTPIVNTEHNAFERPDIAPLGKKEYERKYVWNRRYAYVTVLTEADSRCVEGVLNHLSVLPNPLAFQPASFVPKKKKEILAVGRLDAWHYKGFDLLIKAWGKIAKRHPEWTLRIVGQGSEDARCCLLTFADEQALGEQIEFVGYQSDILPFYQRAAIYVLSSRYEGFGMVLIEAMSQGCAPIACDYKGRQREIITSDDEGLVCPVENVDALAEAMNKMIGEEDYRTRVQQNAIERSKHFLPNNIMDRWKVILGTLNC